MLANFYWSIEFDYIRPRNPSLTFRFLLPPRPIFFRLFALLLELLKTFFCIFGFIILKIRLDEKVMNISMET